MSGWVIIIPILLLHLNTVILSISAESIPPDNCGERAALAQDFTSNGDQSWLGEWPWHAIILHRINQSSPSYACGGTIITSRTILTAAHCMYPSFRMRQLNPSELLILAGITNLIQPEHSLQNMSVEQIILHENFQSDELVNDIALLKLTGNLEFTDYVKPACLWSDLADGKLIIGELGYVTGWGQNKYGEQPKQLHHAAMSIVSREDCRKSDRAYYTTYVYHSKCFCAGFHNGTSLGLGDSGGGLYIRHGGKWILRGVVSNGKFNRARQLDTSSFIVFVDVTHFVPWINNKTIKHSIANVSLENPSSNQRFVDLKHNKLTPLNKAVLDTLNHSAFLTNDQQSNNSLTCDCSSEDFMHFVLENHPILILCEDGQSIDSLTVNALCEKNTSRIYIICLFLACSGFILGIFAAFYYYYQIEIKVWLFTHNLFLWFVTEEDLDKDKQYDAFISYSHKDALFVERELVLRMENLMNLKTCVHVRDWIPGKAIPEQINSSVKNSRRTVIVLSKHFLESTWAQMEFRMANRQSLADKRNRLFIIVLGDLGDVESMDSELKACLKMNTYVKREDPWFWDKLRYAMPHPDTAAKLKKQRGKRSEQEMVVMLENVKEAEPESEIN